MHKRYRELAYSSEHGFANNVWPDPVIQLLSLKLLADNAIEFLLDFQIVNF